MGARKERRASPCLDGGGGGNVVGSGESDNARGLVQVDSGPAGMGHGYPVSRQGRWVQVVGR